nr:TadE/TadG family type IV pilus assembly protein [uncultured Rhodopila sp.]
MRPVIRFARGLARNRSGATIEEFAIISLALLSLIVFLIEGSFQLLTAAVLQYGLREAARFGITGQTVPPSMAANPPASREAAIADIISGAALGLINPSYLAVSETVYPSFNTVGAAGKGVAGAGGSGSVVQYQVTYFQPWLLSGAGYFPVLATGLSGITYTLSTVVQNENFPTN